LKVFKAKTVRRCEFVHPPLDWVQHVEIELSIGWDLMKKTATALA